VGEIEKLVDLMEERMRELTSIECSYVSGGLMGSSTPGLLSVGSVNEYTEAGGYTVVHAGDQNFGFGFRFVGDSAVEITVWSYGSVASGTVQAGADGYAFNINGVSGILPYKSDWTDHEMGEWLRSITPPPGEMVPIN
jgi:hypothetical protein